ncbi:MAG TPA: hypothetical protein ENI35_06885 [Candidatus Desulfofervidus auxilii]|uniref:YXWGXW repeat-containing protein n=1 Tax=Desulfofervidus auxilii TaxID=1621989 RepID=A0A7C1ZFG9_DESA2|nr:hypothetical protein [Candidatus Desulfofervidus auxilii]
MFRRFKLFLIGCIIILPLVFSSCVHAKPPKPGPNFVWVAPHTTPNGVFIPGHWKYVGPAKKGKVWIPGHYRPNGKWIPGHWKILTPPRAKAVWVPGHYGPGGRWIPGHWR